MRSQLAATEVVTNVTEVPEAHKKHMADSEKEKGNEAFYSKDFSEAEAYYSRSLQYQADDASAWANRALAVTPDSLDVHKVRRGFEGFWDTDLVLPSYGLELFILKIVTSDRPAAELFLRQTHPDLRKKYLGIEAKHEVKACSYRIGTHALLWNLQITGTTSKEYSA
ncbi:Spag1 [Symbiodinium microadriaticum]|nr:Spag1 [Symbiodinium microadriaticum]